MGWFWGASDNEKSDPTSKDPLRNLDPALRDFLVRESPIKYNSSNPPLPRSQVSPNPLPQPEQGSLPPHTSPESAADADAKAPPQSLFKDGRYAHLWSTYKPQTELESASKSDAEKISDVLEGFKQRKAEIGRVALENCALEQWDVNECFRSGGWVSRMTLCRAENRKLERCYLMQAKFLKALGYLSTYDRPPEVDEQIQMHADALYHRMLDQEAAVESAKAEGRPIPIFPPLVSKKATKTSPSTIPLKLQPSDLSSAIQKQLKKRLEGLDDKEREIEEQAITAEINAGELVAGQLESIYKKHVEEQNVRKEQGEETIGDKLSSIFGSR